MSGSGLAQLQSHQTKVLDSQIVTDDYTGIITNEFQAESTVLGVSREVYGSVALCLLYAVAK